MVSAPFLRLRRARLGHSDGNPLAAGSTCEGQSWRQRPLSAVAVSLLVPAADERVQASQRCAAGGADLAEAAWPAEDGRHDPWSRRSATMTRTGTDTMPDDGLLAVVDSGMFSIIGPQMSLNFAYAASPFWGTRPRCHCAWGLGDSERARYGCQVGDSATDCGGQPRSERSRCRGHPRREICRMAALGLRAGIWLEHLPGVRTWWSVIRPAWTWRHALARNLC